jgi:uroporphyrinogen decarboxylase
MKEYREVRKKNSFLEMCKTPKIASEITMQPINSFGFDAAILFSDILVPVEAMGVDLDFIEGKGPELKTRIKEREDVDSLKVPDPVKDLSFVFEAIQLLRKKLEVPLIGFSGAPFTLASYIIEGGSSKNYLKTKTLMYNEPAIWKALMSKLSKTVSNYLNAQIDGGAQAVQLFDSWVGCLSPEDYRRFILPHTRNIFNSLNKDVPHIHFGTGTATLLELMATAGGDVIGADWRISLDDAWNQIGHKRGVQGNLDPVALFAPPDEIVNRTKEILKRAGGRPGHVFNLGHGILPSTPIESVKILVDTVKKFSAR